MHAHAVEDGHKSIGCLSGQVTETAGICQDAGSALKRRTAGHDFIFGFHEADDMPDIDVFRGAGQADATIPAPGFSCLSRDDSRGRTNDRHAPPARPGVGRVETCSKRAKARPAYFHYGRQVSLFTAGHSPGVVLGRPPDKEAALLEKAFLRASFKIPHAVWQHHPPRLPVAVTGKEKRVLLLFFRRP